MQGGLAAARGAGPLRPGPGWLGTKTRECGLGRPAEPPSVSHLYFLGLGNPWLLPPRSSGPSRSPLPEPPLAPCAPGPLLQPARPGCPEPPLPSCPLVLHRAPGPFSLAPQSRARAWRLGLPALGPSSASRPGTLGLSFCIYDRRGKSHLWSWGGYGETELIPSCFFPKKRELQALLMFSFSLKNLSDFQ